MPFFWPQDPLPSSVQVPSILDPSYQYETDQGYVYRRSKYPRPRRVFQVDYLGLTSAQLRLFREFIGWHRLNVTPFSWSSLTNADNATYANTTPIQVTVPHMWFTGQSIGFTNATNAALNGFYKITRLQPNVFSLNGTTAAGVGTCTVFAYLPLAIGHYPDGRLESATKLIGPESVNTTRGRFNETYWIEEIF